MSLARWSIAAFTVGALWISPISRSWADTSDVAIDQLLSDIQKVLVKVRDASAAESLPAMTSVDLTLRATLTKQADGSLHFRILEAGASATDESIQELHLHLGPPEPADKSPVAVTLAPFADAIIDAARDVKNAANRDPPLHLTALEATVQFMVEKEASGSIVFLGGKVGNKNSQEITLTFGRKQ